MIHRNLIAAIGLGAALAATIGAAQAFDESKYPDLRGEWRGTGGNKWPTPAPLTAEYQAIFEANLQRPGGRRTGRHAHHRLPAAPGLRGYSPKFSYFYCGELSNMSSAETVPEVTLGRVVAPRNKKSPAPEFRVKTFRHTYIVLSYDKQPKLLKRKVKMPLNS